MSALEVAAVPLELAGWTLVTADSGETHSIAASGYNARRVECAEGARLLGVASLRDADARAAAGLPSPLDRRALHVIEENARVDGMVQALRAGGFGGTILGLLPPGVVVPDAARVVRAGAGARIMERGGARA